VREGYEKQCGVVPRQLLHRFDSKDQWGRDIIRQQKEIDKLKDQLKKTEEQLAVTQM